MGKPRTCGTCHDTKAQVGKSVWRFFEDRDVTKPFTGSYTITADKNGIRFSNVAWEQPSLAANRKLEDIAPFAVLPTMAWDVKGINFSLPYNKQRTDAARKDLERFLAELDKRKDDPRAAEIRAVAHHNLAMAKQMVKAKK